MQLELFSEEFPVNDQKLNIVVCIFQKDISMSDQSPLNQMLEELQIELKNALDEYSEIELAFVFEDKALGIRGFEKLERNTPVYYKEPDKTYNLAHIWLMGMALLEQKQQEEEPGFVIENRLYLVTDAKLPQDKVRCIVEVEGDVLRMNSRFEKLDFIPFLWKSKEADGDVLEEYIRKHGKGIHIF